MPVFVCRPPIYLGALRINFHVDYNVYERTNNNIFWRGAIFFNNVSIDDDCVSVSFITVIKFSKLPIHRVDCFYHSTFGRPLRGSKLF